MKILLKELTGYAFASTCALALDISTLWFLVQFCSWGHVGAATVSFIAGAAVAYALSVRVAFKEHRLDDRQFEFLSFIALGVVGLGINAIVLKVGTTYLGLHYILAKCAAAGCTFTSNFVLRRHFLFVRPRYAAASLCESEGLGRDAE